MTYHEPHTRPSTARFQTTTLPCGSACRIAENVELGPIPEDVWYVSRDGVANVVSTSRTVAEPGGLEPPAPGLPTIACNPLWEPPRTPMSQSARPFKSR